VNGAATTGTTADGTYTFEIKDAAGAVKATTTVTITNGVSSEAQVDNLVPGTYTVSEDTSKNPDLFAYDVQVSCSTHNNVWCYNAPQVNIRKTAKEGSAKQSSASGNASSKTN
jgi:hypothetical protein